MNTLTKTASVEAAKFVQNVLERIKWYPLIAGLLLTFGVALLANSLQKIPGLSLFSTLILAILLGILVRNTIGYPKVCQPGLSSLSNAFSGLPLFC